jgi:large subunit ribosomal protein L19e
MSVETVRRVAARIWGIGSSRVRIIDEKKAREALTSEDVKNLMRQGLVIKKAKKGVSRGRARIKIFRKKMGRGRGEGSRKGTKNAVKSLKQRWVEKVRSQRDFIKKNKQKLGVNYRKAYKLVKGNFFRDKKHLKSFIESLK